MPHANSEAFSKAAGLRSSKHRHKRQTTHICPSRTVRVSTTESITEVPDVDQLRKARTEFYEKSPDKRNKSPNREMTYISESRATQAGPREASRKSSGGSQHGSQRKAHGRHRHHRKVDDVERDREIVYVYRHAGREERTQATAISQDLPSRTTAATRRQSRSTISDHKRQDSQGQSRRRHTSLIDVASKPSTHTRDSVGETDKNHERSLRRSATSNRYAGRGAVLTDHPRVIRYARRVIHINASLTVSGAPLCVKGHYHPLVLPFKEAIQAFGLRQGPWPRHSPRPFQSVRDQKICPQILKRVDEVLESSIRCLVFPALCHQTCGKPFQI